jgi:uncharacterized protein YegL
VAATGQPVSAAGGSVTASLAATSPIIPCNATTTVTLTIDGVSPAPSQVPVDVMLVLDKSGSMGGQPIADLRSGANSFVTDMDDNDGSTDGNITASRVGEVSFNNAVTVDIGLTHDANAVHTKINALVAGGSTNIGDALNAGAAQLSGGTAKDVLILMTDGQSNVGPDPMTAASSAKAAGIEVFTIGLGNGINVNQLKAMATDPSHFYQAPTSAQLSSIFHQIATGVAGPAGTNLIYSVQPAAGFVIAGGSATMGTVSAAPAALTWTLAELRTETAQVTYTLQHTGAAGGTLPIHAAATLTYKDSDGNAQTVGYAGVTVDVQGCNQPPVANAGPDQTVPQGAGGLAAVTLDGTGSTDDGQIQPLDYAWSEGATQLGTGAVLAYSFPLGTHTVTLKVSDGQYGATDDVVITVTDPFPPVTTAALAGTAGANGWYTSPVTVTLSAADNIGGSGVAGTTYSVDGGAPAAYAGPFTVAGDGVHTVQYYSQDVAGNVEAAQQVTFMIDTTAPSITGMPDRAPNANGWYNADVTVSFTCADATSGLAACSGPSTLGEGGGQTVTGTATDNAGNAASATVGPLNVDKTAPVITVSSPMSQDYADDVMLSVAWTATDALSGIDSQSATLDGAAIANGAVVDLSTVSLGAHTLVVTATDKAGNSTAVTVTFQVKVTYDSLEALKHRYFEQGLIKNQGIVTSLDQKLRAARDAHDRGQYGTEDNILGAFISEVHAQAGKGIMEPAVTTLIRDAQWLMDHN